MAAMHHMWECVLSDILCSGIASFSNFYSIYIFNANAIDEASFKESVYKRTIGIKRMESPDEVSGFYNPLIYNFEKRKNILNDLNALTLDDVNKVIKKYQVSFIF